MITKDVNKLKLLNRVGLIDDELLSASDDKALININDLHVNFKRGGKLFEAVKGANLTINDGEILGLVGESGSGKTTLGRATISLWDHALGNVEIEGKRTPQKRIKSVSKKNVWVYKKGQMIFQDPTSSLNRQMKVLDIVNEGQKNFKTVADDQKAFIEKETQLINDAKEIIEALTSKKKYEKKMKDHYVENFIVETISKSKDEAVTKLVEDFNRATELVANISKLERDLSESDKTIDKKIKIIKQKRSSDKIILGEETTNDKEFLNTSLESELAEFKKFEKKAKKDEGKVQKRVDKRNERFFKRAQWLAKNLPASLRNALPTKFDDVNDLEKAIEKLADREKLTDEQKFYAASITITLQILIKKQEKLVSPLNTSAFEFIYYHLNDVLTARIHFLNTLLRDLNVRLEKELDKKENAETKDLTKFYAKSVEYLKTYKEILISLIKEFAGITLKIKGLFLNHEENGIKHFYKETLKINKMSDTLQISLITWKAQEAIKYHKRLKDKQKLELKEKISINKKELSKIEKTYKNIHEPMKDIESAIGDKIKKYVKEFEIEDELFEKQHDKLEELKEAVTRGEQKIKAAKKILNSKKHRKAEEVRRIKETLLKVGLNDDAINKYPSQFSGGQKQRIGIARTIITKPKFIVADEPISALDVSVQAQVINLMKDIHSEMGLTMLFIAHDLQMVHYISDRIAVIYRGNIVEYGDADKVYKSPKHPYTKSLIGAMPSIEEVGKPLEVSDYNWADHEYNEFSCVKHWEVDKDHFVYGTEEEIKEWK